MQKYHSTTALRNLNANCALPLQRTVIQRYLYKYGECTDAQVFENFSYGYGNVNNVVADMLAKVKEGLNGCFYHFFNPGLRVCGIASGSHAAFRHCAVIVFATHFKEVRFFFESVRGFFF